MSLILLFLENWWPLLLAYVVAATPFGLLIGRCKGIDIREHGSGNIGATNVLRTLGRPAGTLCLVLDVFKGVIPVVLAKYFFPEQALLHVLTAVAAILGHNYTFWLGFKGGKGIATTAGAALPIMPIAILLAVAAWIIVLKISQYVSVASIAAAIIVPLAFSIRSFLEGHWNIPALIFALFLCVMAVWRHRSNIARLRRGEENKVGAKN